MPALKTYDIFISHAWAYGEQYDRLIRLLNSAPFFTYRNYSAPSDNPLKTLGGYPVKTKSQIEDAIDRKIRPVNCVLVLSGMYLAYREWMQYEIDTALQFRKPIIGIEPWGAQRIPSEVYNAADEMVGWNTNSIVEAIRRHSI